jgi:hypothetical protein
MDHRRIIVVVCAILAGTPGAGYAAKVKVWHHHAASHYEKAQFNHAVVTSEGSLRLSRRLKPLATLQAVHVWSVVEDRDGNLFAATGDEGKVFRITPAGEVSTVYTSRDSQVFCLAVLPNGDIIAGTGPSGLLLRLKSDGKTETLATTGESYVWCLATDAAGQTMYAGTGPKGRIYALDRDRKLRLHYPTKQEHVLALATGPDGNLYAGTDKDGLVYRIGANGKGFVVYSTPQSEVRSLLATPDGVYAGTSSPTRRRGLAATSSSDSRLAVASRINSLASSQSEVSSPIRTANEDASSGTAHGSGSSTTDALERAHAVPSTPPKIGENSLYRIGVDGAVRELFRERVLLLSLLRENGRVLVGTGMDGQLFEINERSKERSEIARLDHGHIHCLCRRRDGSVVLGAGDPGKLYVLGDGYAQRGTIISDVLDAKLISRWGSLRWKADSPAGTSITVATRSGNTAEPNETWSDWSAEETDLQRAVVRAPAARFLQYRVSLSSNDSHATPALHSLAVRYMTINQAPEVTGIQVPDMDATNLENPKKVRLKWTATDSNDDELSYSLYVRKDGWKSWVCLEDNLEKSEHEWDTTTMPSGLYQARVVASDRKDNPAEEALSGERVSTPFVVTHTPPEVKLKLQGIDADQAVIEATATDPFVRITSASFSVNGKKWINVFPIDGLFDSKEESFRFKTESLEPGTYVVVLRVQDAAGNVASADTVFTVKKKSGAQ